MILSAGQSNAEAKFKVRCRKTIHGTFKVEKFDNWEIVTNDMESQLTGVSIQTSSKAVPDAFPDNFKDKGKMSGTFKITEEESWIVCHHPKLKMVIEQKLPPGLKTCTATEQSDAVGIECN